MSRPVQLSALLALVLLVGCASQPYGVLTTTGNEDGTVSTLFPVKPPNYYQNSTGVIYYCPNGGAVGGVCSPVRPYSNYGSNYNYWPAPAPAQYPVLPNPPAAPQPGGIGSWLAPPAQAQEIPRPAPQPVPQPGPAPPGDVAVDNSCGWWRVSDLWCKQ
jgi:hypothetical protein